jgi:uncharacterized membrane protein YccF (DUF307 family)
VITIVGIPWARAAFNIALYTLLPFGLDGSQPRRLYRMGRYRDGPLGTIGNLMWLVLAGWWLAFAHFIIAPALAIKVIGCPSPGRKPRAAAERSAARDRPIERVSSLPLFN